MHFNEEYMTTISLKAELTKIMTMVKFARKIKFKSKESMQTVGY
ncbi:hypothetical protein JCM19235_4755 [Vibrio maritimus]|uniref:Uncharacterized protein n=1 Tax=Vibrio maritimus TaxID=990268 RepID=A0A090S371_9VIBR|nr:hypothetical protein JCM19235_4755 [Vibrio maritimus]